jgi:DNA (cytosine-5)-methyltransferase 1
MTLRTLDLFCGAGGATKGLQRAGFHVTGVDIKCQPRYCGDAFVQADALEPPFDLRSFDFIWSSPPCQAYTQMNARWRGLGGKADNHPDLIGPVRDMLTASGVSYVIENVIGARQKMNNGRTLNGMSFGLGVYRPRLFEANFFWLSPPRSGPSDDCIGVYGERPDGRRLWTRLNGNGAKRSIFRCAKTLEQGSVAMGIDWMEWGELTQAVPPAYSEFIGRAFLAQMWEAAE